MEIPFHELRKNYRQEVLKEGPAKLYEVKRMRGKLFCPSLRNDTESRPDLSPIKPASDGGRSSRTKSQRRHEMHFRGIRRDNFPSSSLTLNIIQRFEGFSLFVVSSVSVGQVGLLILERANNKVWHHFGRLFIRGIESAF